jgi:hypothetical protein
MTKDQLILLANDLVWPCHQYEDENVWVLLVDRKMGIDPANVILVSWDSHFKTFVDDFSNNPVQRKIVTTLIRYCKATMTSSLAEHIVDKFQRSALKLRYS